MLVNTLVGSLFVYKMNVLPPVNNDMLEEYNKVISNFLWNQKLVRIPMQTLNLPKDKGG